jgi:hypothetical protein
MEITTGKLKSVINTLLLLAFAAILDNNVSDAEKPHATNATVNKKTQLVVTGFEIKSMNMAYPVKESNTQRKKL